MGPRIPAGNGGHDDEDRDEVEAADEPTAPAAPARWAVWVGRVGRTLIALGVLMVLFAGYQLWGTGIQHSRAQSSLEDEFADRRAEALAATTTSATPTSPPPSSTAAPVPTSGNTTSVAGTSTTEPPTTEPPAPATTAVPLTEPIEQGDGIARIVIERIGVDEIVVAGVSRGDLQRGPGHYPDTPLPGQVGNAAIAGHRTTYGAPFARVDELEVGDAIDVTTFTGEYRYVVSETIIVYPEDTWVLDQTEDAELTLTSCHPKYSARQRIVLKAKLDASDSSEPTPPTPGIYETSGAPPDEVDAVTEQPTPSPASTQPGATIPTAPERAVDELGEGWFSEPAAWPPTLLWAALGGIAAFYTWRSGQRWRRLVVYAAAAPLLVVILYFFFENLSRLLPPSI